MFQHNAYLLVALHQLKGLTFNIVLTANDIGEDWGKPSAVELGRWYLDVELTSVLVLEIKLDIVLLCTGSAK